MKVSLSGSMLSRKYALALWVALGVFFVNMAISVFITEFTFTSGYVALWKTLLRFFRLSANLTLPLLLLPTVCSWFQPLLNGFTRRLVLAKHGDGLGEHLSLTRLLLRPFQGIGLSLLFATKLLVFLQVYTGTETGAAAILPSGQFSLLRFVTVSIIGVLVSLTLSLLWALDDLGVRHYNLKTQEIKLAGKYLGMLLPVIFGFYGILEILEDLPRAAVARYVAQMVIILYPPFVIFGAFHASYIKRRGAYLLRKLKVHNENTEEDKK